MLAAIINSYSDLISAAIAAGDLTLAGELGRELGDIIRGWRE